MTGRRPIACASLVILNDSPTGHSLLPAYKGSMIYLIRISTTLPTGRLLAMPSATVGRILNDIRSMTPEERAR